MKFARDGLPFIIFMLAATAAAGAFLSPLAALPLLLLSLLVMWFFRDPERYPEGGEYADGAFYSPADGRIVEISLAEHAFTGEALKVGIFMNVFSVHVNRAPCTGRVDFMEYIPGKKIAAFAPKASEINERNFVGLSTMHGPVMMTQIAGLLARRIVCRLTRGTMLDAGQRYGMIKLGSRVDIYLPKDVTLSVKMGDKVFAGRSLIGKMPESV